MGMNLNQVRVVDPILTNVATGYKNQEFVGSRLFPRVPVSVAGGQIIEFGKEAFRLYNAARTPGSNTKRVQFGYAGKPFALTQDALEGKVPFEHMRDAQRVPGINLGTRAVNNVMRIHTLSLEVQQANIARNAANYDSDHKVDLTATKWSNDANDPAVHVETGKEAIRASIGVYPNLLLLSAKAFAAARRNAKVRENFKYTSSKSITPEMLAEYLDVDEVVVGKAIYASGADDAFTDVWGVDAILAYVAPNNGGLGTDAEEPSYGYTYAMEGNPMVEEPYMDRNAKSWIYPVNYERAPVLSGMTAGYLMQNVV